MTRRFRAWDKRSRLLTTHFAIIDGKPMRKNYDGIYFVEHDLILMQWTGLLDKRNKEIYEGDIVEDYNEDTYKVVYVEHEACFLAEPITGIAQYYFDNENWEVIGNIFENPELLKK